MDKDTIINQFFEHSNIKEPHNKKKSKLPFCFLWFGHFNGFAPIFLSFILVTTPVTGAFWPSFSSHHHHHQVAIKDGHRVIIEFEEQCHSSNKITISQTNDSGVTGFGFTTFKTTVATAYTKTTEVANVSAAKTGKSTINIIAKAMKKLGQTIRMAGVDDDSKGTLKDLVVKLEEWDPVDSPKRICEDVGHNASVKIKDGVEEAKETVENIVETSPNEALTRSKTAINDVLDIVLSERWVTGWCHLLGFSTAYGMGVWVTFFSGCVLGKCLTKQEGAMVSNMMNMVYFRTIGCCVGAAVFGFLVGQRRRGCLSNKMVMFQGFNLVSALVMVLINLIFLEPQRTKVHTYLVTYF
ncbi:hypothetical protein Hanom_Chr07g00594361 [Helianthus anomalus]